MNDPIHMDDGLSSRPYQHCIGQRVDNRDDFSPQGRMQAVESDKLLFQDPKKRWNSELEWRVAALRLTEGLDSSKRRMMIPPILVNVDK